MATERGRETIVPECSTLIGMPRHNQLGTSSQVILWINLSRQGRSLCDFICNARRGDDSMKCAYVMLGAFSLAISVSKVPYC